MRHPYRVAIARDKREQFFAIAGFTIELINSLVWQWQQPTMDKLIVDTQAGITDRHKDDQDIINTT